MAPSLATVVVAKPFHDWLKPFSPPVPQKQALLSRPLLRVLATSLGDAHVASIFATPLLPLPWPFGLLVSFAPVEFSGPPLYGLPPPSLALGLTTYVPWHG